MNTSALIEALSALNGRQREYDVVLQFGGSTEMVGDVQSMINRKPRTVVVESGFRRFGASEVLEQVLDEYEAPGETANGDTVLFDGLQHPVRYHSLSHVVTDNTNRVITLVAGEVLNVR